MTFHKYILTPDRTIKVVDDLMEWARWMEDHPLDRIVKQTALSKEDMWVSTVFMGLDYNFHPAGPPILFETAVFRGHDEERNLVDIVGRWTTYEEALLGHINAVNFIEENTKRENG